MSELTMEAGSSDAWLYVSGDLTDKLMESAESWARRASSPWQKGFIHSVASG